MNVDWFLDHASVSTVLPMAVASALREDALFTKFDIPPVGLSVRTYLRHEG